MKNHAAAKQTARRLGFTLIELLGVIGIISVIAAILFPVFVSVRERGRRTACLSNERQLGIAMMQYVADSGEQFPNGFVVAGERWVSQTYPYLKSAAVYQCPDAVFPQLLPNNFPVGFGLSSNLGQHSPEVVGEKFVQHAEGYGLGTLTAPSRTVLLFEIDNGGVQINGAPKSGDGSVVGDAGEDGSAQGDGEGGTLCDGTYPLTGSVFGWPKYATGNVGGRLLNGATKNGRMLDGNTGSTPQHQGGANYVACDGHAVWLRPETVSGGQSQPPSGVNCGQDDTSHACVGAYTAAGTANGKYALTFSVK